MLGIALIIAACASAAVAAVSGFMAFRKGHQNKGGHGFAEGREPAVDHMRYAAKASHGYMGREDGGQ